MSGRQQMDLPPGRVDRGERRRADRWRLRQGITRLRLAEFRAAEHLPTQEMRELTLAIDLLVWAARTLEDDV